MGTPFSMGQGPQPMGVQPQQQALGGQMDPRSQYLAQALQSMHSQPQGSVGGLGMNLLAQALMQQQQQRQQQNANTPPQWGGQMGQAAPPDMGG